MVSSIIIGGLLWTWLSCGVYVCGCSWVFDHVRVLISVLLLQGKIELLKHKQGSTPLFRLLKTTSASPRWVPVPPFPSPSIFQCLPLPLLVHSNYWTIRCGHHWLWWWNEASVVWKLYLWGDLLPYFIAGTLLSSDIILDSAVSNHTKLFILWLVPLFSLPIFNHCHNRTQNSPIIRLLYSCCSYFK